MSDIFVISDTHFGHANCWAKFKVKDPDWHYRCPNDQMQCDAECRSTHPTAPLIPMRPFTSTEEMDETMVERWNKVVPVSAKVYHLGDVVVRSENYDVLRRLNGHKRLILGNHDHADMAVYAKYFEKIGSSRNLEGLLLTHIPVHPQGIMGKIKANVHGHIHNNDHRMPTQLPKEYVNVCVEVVNYTPVNIDDIRARL